MSNLLTELYVQALGTAAAIALPVIAAIGVIGVAVGILQALTGISDQNISFGPKLAIVWLCALLGGSAAFALLVALARTVLGALPQLAR